MDCFGLLKIWGKIREQDIRENSDHLPIRSFCKEWQTSVFFAVKPQPVKDFCTEDKPCQEGGGDCDDHNSHTDCAGSLQCGVDNCRDFPGQSLWSPRYDCCYYPGKWIYNMQICKCEPSVGPFKDYVFCSKVQEGRLLWTFLLMLRHCSQIVYSCRCSFCTQVL